jgi:hypothetical protein
MRFTRCLTPRTFVREGIYRQLQEGPLASRKAERTRGPNAGYRNFGALRSERADAIARKIP